MSGIRLLVADWHGIYVPRVFVEQFDTIKWGVSDKDVSDVSGGPENCEWYWEAWEAILNSAEYTDSDGHVWQLSQDGDLWAYCEALMSDEEYENFFGERREEAA